MVWCIFWSVVTTWLLLGMYSAFTTYHFGFKYLAYSFAVGSLWIFKFMGGAVGIIIIAFIASIAVFFYLHIKKRAERLLDEEIKEQEEELRKLKSKIDKYAKDVDEIDRIQAKGYSFMQSLFGQIYRFIESKEKLLDALRNSNNRRLDVAIRKGTISPKGAERAQKKFEKFLDEIKQEIAKEKDIYNSITGDADRLFQQIDKSEELYKNHKM